MGYSTIINHKPLFDLLPGYRLACAINLDIEKCHFALDRVSYIAGDRVCRVFHYVPYDLVRIEPIIERESGPSFSHASFRSLTDTGCCRCLS